ISRQVGASNRGTILLNGSTAMAVRADSPLAKINRRAGGRKKPSGLPKPPGAFVANWFLSRPCLIRTQTRISAELPKGPSPLARRVTCTCEAQQVQRQCRGEPDGTVTVRQVKRVLPAGAKQRRHGDDAREDHDQAECQDEP